MRQFWLKDPLTKNVWNLTPENPYFIMNGCFFNTAKGLGLENDFKQTQVKTDYFIDEVLSKNINITGILYFNGDKHVNNFYDFVRDFQRTFEFHYSPDGKIIAADQLSASWYKPCGILKIEKAEKKSSSWYEVPITLKTQSDIWRRDISIVSTKPEPFGQALIYPFFYPYFYGGESVLAVDIKNTGKETEPVIEITNNSVFKVVNPLWVSEFLYTDIYNRLISEPQRARFIIDLSPNRTLLVDSRALVNGLSAQRAVILDKDGQVIENVYNRQEADFDYINFITLQKGDNKVFFNVGSQTGIDIKISYQETRELI